jgi:hypothetical protein
MRPGSTIDANGMYFRGGARAAMSIFSRAFLGWCGARQRLLRLPVVGDFVVIPG